MMSSTKEDSLGLGQPVKVTNRLFNRGSTAVIYGRVTGFKGDEYKGMWPILVITTPHNSEVIAGRFHVESLNGEEMKELEKLEQAAREDGIDPYAGGNSHHFQIE